MIFTESLDSLHQQIQSAWKAIDLSALKNIARQVFDWHIQDQSLSKDEHVALRTVLQYLENKELTHPLYLPDNLALYFDQRI